jgi:hypothetical protein
VAPAANMLGIGRGELIARRGGDRAIRAGEEISPST